VLVVKGRAFKKWRLKLLLFGLIFASILLFAACRSSRPTPVVPPPSVAITSPANGYTVQAGVDVPVNSTANDAQGVLKVELWVDGSLYRVDESPQPQGQTTFVVTQPWHAAVPGLHTVVVKAYSRSGQVAESLPVEVDVQTSAVLVPTDTPTLVLPADTPSAVTDTPRPATNTPPPLPTDTPVSPTPTDTPTMPPPVPTDSPTPSPEPTATSTLRPGPTATPTPVLAVPEPFGHVWAAVGGSSGRLGDPVAGAVLDRWGADQFFEGGLTYWRNNEFSPANWIYVLFYGDGTDESQGESQGTAWLRFDDLWRETMPQFSCPEAEANGDLGPKRGFGKLWCEETAVRNGLKLPVVVEQGAGAGFQDFEGGTMIWLRRVGYVYVLYEGGGWARFSDQ